MIKIFRKKQKFCLVGEKEDQAINDDENNEATKIKVDNHERVILEEVKNNEESESKKINL